MRIKFYEFKARAAREKALAEGVPAKVRRARYAAALREDATTLRRMLDDPDEADMTITSGF